MKNFTVRLSVLALALTGFAASTVTPKAAAHSSAIFEVAMGTSPAALCPPSRPGPCALD